ncbi:MAG: hypothetical protein DRP35_01455 [Candidatus Zixiibacteriota bacterium]|nr:MAG: hypothetical protein DRP35_01455 [candidate division Zixibacteria bacterium]
MVNTTSSSPAQISFLGEAIRKLTHTGALIIPVSYYYFDMSKRDMLFFVGGAFLLMLLIDISRIKKISIWNNFIKKIISPIIRQHEFAGDFTGATYILLSIFLTILLFSKPIAVTAIAFIMVGDSLAALIGRKFGRHKVFKTKSIEGFMGCLSGTLIVAYFAPELTFYVTIPGAVIAAIVELLPLQIDDNLTVPLISGLFMMIIKVIIL